MRIRNFSPSRFEGVRLLHRSRFSALVSVRMRNQYLFLFSNLFLSEEKTTPFYISRGKSSFGIFVRKCHTHFGLPHHIRGNKNKLKESFRVVFNNQIDSL